MKHLLLSFIIVFVSTIAGYGQQVEVTNTTSCDIEVTVTGYDFSCTALASNIFTIPPSLSHIFTDPSAVDFQVQVIVDPSGTPLILPPVHVFAGTCLDPLLPVLSITPTTRCGATTDIEVMHDIPMSVFPNAKVYVNPL